MDFSARVCIINHTENKTLSARETPHTINHLKGKNIMRILPIIAITALSIPFLSDAHTHETTAPNTDLHHAITATQQLISAGDHEPSSGITSPGIYPGVILPGVQYYQLITPLPSEPLGPKYIFDPHTNSFTQVQ